MKKQLLFLSLFAFNVLIAQVPDYVPINGLVGYWPFSGNANDGSGNGNNGNVSPSTLLSSDRFLTTNSAYNWNGTNSPITVSNNITQNFSNGVTFSIWINQSGIYCNTCLATNYVTKGRDIDAGGITLGLNHSTQKFYFQVTGSPLSVNPPYSIFFSNSTISYNSWTNLVGTYDENEIKIYVNGVLDIAYNYTSSIPINIDSLLFGKQKGTGVFADNYNMLGKLDDIGIWNRALTQAEITGLYTTLGGEQTPANNQVAVYPNPAKEQIIIDCGNLSNTSGWSFQILNTLGQEVLNGKINSQQNVVSLNSLNESGVYLVKIYDASNNLLNTKKIVLQ